MNPNFSVGGVTRPPLAVFLRENGKQVIETWSRKVAGLPHAKGLARPALFDHIPQLIDSLTQSLEAIAAGEAPSASGDAPDWHALTRLDQGYDLKDVVTEYSVLRATIEELWEDAGGTPIDRREYLVLDRTIDEAVGAAVHRYAVTRERTLVAVDRISTAALQSDHLEAFLPRLLQVLMETTESVDGALIMMAQQGRFRVRASAGIPERELEGFSLAEGEGFVGAIARDGAPREVRSAATDPDTSNPVLRSIGAKALYGVPMFAEGKVTGVAMMASHTAYEFSSEDKILFRTMANRATALIFQQQLLERERDSRALLDTLLAASPVGIAFLDRELRYVRINEALAKVNGHPVEAHLGKTLEQVLGRELPFTGVFHEVVTSGEPRLDFEYSAPLPNAPDGPVHHWLGNLYPVRDVKGAVMGVGAIILDVTDRTRSMEERKRSEQELQRSAEFREQFIGVLGHDLRNPLSAIYSSAQLLLRREGLEPGQVKGLTRIVRSSDRMARMISDVLDFAKGRLGGGFSLERQRMNMHELCRSVVDELHVSNPERELLVEVSGDGWGEWDPDRVAQAISNLVGNALQHGATDAPVRVMLSNADGGLLLEVTNQGDAIPPALLPVIFEPFRAMRMSSRSEQKSVGLGLWIVQEVVKAHGGTVNVRSTAEAGTTFAVWWPRR